MKMPTSDMVIFDPNPSSYPLEKSLFWDGRQIFFLKASNRISVSENVPYVMDFCPIFILINITYYGFSPSMDFWPIFILILYTMEFWPISMLILCTMYFGSIFILILYGIDIWPIFILIGYAMDFCSSICILILNTLNC